MAAAPIVLVVSAVIVSKAKRPIAAGLAFVLGAVALDVVFAIIILAIAEATGVDSSSGDLAASVDTSRLPRRTRRNAVASRDSPRRASGRCSSSAWRCR
jgi:hypothetical protein